jgi:hypothetical protein
MLSDNIHDILSDIHSRILSGILLAFYIWPFYLTSILAFYLAFYLTYLLAISTWNCFGIVPGVLSSKYSGILSGKCGDTLYLISRIFSWTKGSPEVPAHFFVKKKHAPCCSHLNLQSGTWAAMKSLHQNTGPTETPKWRYYHFRHLMNL